MPHTKRRQVVVGDVHGELDGLTEILVHAGIVDRGGSWVGDNGVLIQTGDVIDRGPHSREAVSLLRRVQQEALASGGRVVRCCGNHELMLLQGDHSYVDFSEPDRLAEELREEIARELVQAAYSDGARLYTHAGLRSSVRQVLIEEIRKARRGTAGRVGRRALADHINVTFKEAVRLHKCRGEDHCIFWIGPSRGGGDEVGGIFWCDYTSILPSDRAWDVPQVFGHTPAREPTLRHAHGLKLINVDGGMSEVYGGHRVYLEIDADGALVQHWKDAARWRKRTLGVRFSK